GIALWLLAGDRRARAVRIAARTCAALIVVFAVATLIQYVTGIDLGAALRLGGVVRHPTPHAAAAFIALAVAFVVIDRRTARGGYVADYLALVAAAIGTTAL